MYRSYANVTKSYDTKWRSILAIHLIPYIVAKTENSVGQPAATDQGKEIAVGPAWSLDTFNFG